MARSPTVISAIVTTLLLSGCAATTRTAPATLEPPIGPTAPCTAKVATLEVPFVAADVSRALEPFQNLQNLQSLADAGIRFYGAEKVFWDDLEPSASSGYQWNEYDAVIREVEALGGDVLPTIWSVSSWATTVPSAANPSSAPAPEHRQRYSDLIEAFVARYDCDGVNDMPGLLYAHDYLQIEDEAENLGDAWIESPACAEHEEASEARFRCAADEYGATLQIAHQAAHAANPDTQVVSFSFNFGDHFDHNPAGMPSISLFAQRRLAFLDQVLTHYSAAFDVIAVQCNYGYAGIPPTVEYVRDAYRLDKPIICADAASMPLIGRQQVQLPDRYADQYPFLTDSEILDILDQGPTDPQYPEISSWWEAEKASLVVKKAVVAADAGVEQIGFQFVMTRWGGRRNVWRHAELLSAGPEHGDVAPAGTPRPVVYALGQLDEMVTDFHTVENLNPIPSGTDPRSWLWMYRFDGEDQAVYVIWSGSGERTVDLRHQIPTASARVTPLVTTLDESWAPIYPSAETVSTGSIPVDETPILVEAEP